MTGKYKSIGDSEKKEAVVKEYIYTDINMSQLSRKYEIPYSTLRRFLKEEIKERKLEDKFLVQYFNVEDFPFLKIGDTYQFDAAFKTWRVKRITKKESDKVFELVPTNNKAARHFICDKQVFDG